MLGIGWIKRKLHYLELYVELMFHMGRKKTANVVDLVSCNMCGSEFLRIDTIVRLLAIENYYDINSYGFELYRKMQTKRMGQEYAEQAVGKFVELIKSVENNGFLNDSRILTDKKLNVLDGSHRLAIALFYKIDNIPVKILYTKEKCDYSIEWFIENCFTSDEMRLILDKAHLIVESMKEKAMFKAVIWAPAVNHAQEIINDIRFMLNDGDSVNNVTVHNFTTKDYERVVRELYIVDDVEKWKIEKKIEHMREYGPCMITMDLFLTQPVYRIKDLSLMPISEKIERVKSAIREKYRESIDDYYYDIIMHVADNYGQSLYMETLLNNPIKMHAILRILEKYDYAVLKLEGNEMLYDFPEHCPVGKDVDILINKEECSVIKREIQEYLEEINDGKYIIKTVENKYSCTIRVEIYGRMFFQIDMIYAHPRLNGSYFDDAMKSRIKKACFYVLDTRYESIYRMVSLRENPQKRHHYEYIVANKMKTNKATVKKYIKKHWQYGLLMEYCRIKNRIDYSSRRELE